jgi:hypothetical protein
MRDSAASRTGLTSINPRTLSNLQAQSVRGGQHMRGGQQSARGGQHLMRGGQQSARGGQHMRGGPRGRGGGGGGDMSRGYSTSMDSDMTSTAGYTLSGGHDHQLQQQVQSEPLMSDGRYQYCCERESSQVK